MTSDELLDHLRTDVLGLGSAIFVVGRLNFSVLVRGAGAVRAGYLRASG